MRGQKTGGRTKGTPNQSTREIRAIAQAHTAEAVEVLVNVMRESKSDAARIAAAKELLDRGHGRSTQAVQIASYPDLRTLSTEELKAEMTELLAKM